MKNYKNYIKENYKDYKPEYTVGTLSYKLQTALDKPGDNDDEIRNLIDIVEDYKYEYKRARWESKSEQDQLIIIFYDYDEMLECLEHEDDIMTKYLELSKQYSSWEESTELEEIIYNLHDENEVLANEIIHQFNREKSYTDIESFFNIFSYDKKIKTIGEDICQEIASMNLEAIRNNVNDIYRTLGFTIVEDDGYCLLFDLKKLENKKSIQDVISSSEALYKIKDINVIEYSDDMEKELNKNINGELGDLLQYVKSNKDEILDNIEFKYGVVEFGGEMVEKFKTYDFQAKYIGDDVKKYEYLEENDILNPQIEKDFGYLVTSKKFDM